jgi:hypothetical protein
VNRGVCRGKVISDLRFTHYFGKKKAVRCCFIIFGNCRPFSNYSVTEAKVVDIIYFVDVRVVVLERLFKVNQKMLAHNLSGGDIDLGVDC